MACTLVKSKVEALAKMLNAMGVDKDDIKEVERLLMKNVGGGVAEDDEHVSGLSEELGMDGRFHARPARLRDKLAFEKENGIASRRLRNLG